MLVPLTLLGLALLSWPARPPAHHRLPPREPALPRRPLRRWLVAAGAGAAAAVLAPGTWWFAPGVGLLGWWAAGRAAHRRSARQIAADRRQVAAQLDLIAACLSAGLAPGAALIAVRRAAGRGTGPGSARTGRRREQGRVRNLPTPSSAGGDDPLDGVAALLAVGADAPAAWAALRGHADLGPLAAAAARSARGGAELAVAFREQAMQIRKSAADADAAAAARAGVLMTAPLAACFLPAFLILGLAPVVIGLVQGMHLW